MNDNAPAQIHADLANLKKELEDVQHVASGGRTPRQEPVAATTKRALETGAK
jgi:hypothetical protein